MASFGERKAAMQASKADKEAIKASLQEDKSTAESDKQRKENDLEATQQAIASLHANCDFLLGNFATRKANREAEIADLGDAKAVLSGADYSLLQSNRAVFLSRRQ